MLARVIAETLPLQETKFVSDMNEVFLSRMFLAKGSGWRFLRVPWDENVSAFTSFASCMCCQRVRNGMASPNPCAAVRLMGPSWYRNIMNNYLFT